ncbi:hypothetical protein RJT11_05305 [Segatella copri]|uniref:DUF3987 domain-containing protein n=1 Tax=Segatella copri TaxID=165179 RepID=UPI00294B39B8|nr:DUF3987 domain-containing protein [Segatella copri]WOG04943.1 hypothetical protein RJT11_05305 [Segatella copri]
MSVYLISVRGGRKVALPVLTEESYRRLRNTSSQQANLRQARMGNQAAKRRLIQFNYSGYYPDGVVKGCRLPSQAFGFDVDDAGEFERIAKMLMEKRGPAMESQGTGTRRGTAGSEIKGAAGEGATLAERLGLLMLERSASQGGHAVFKREKGKTILENQVRIAKALDCELDTNAHDINRVYFSSTADKDELLFLSPELFNDQYGVSPGADVNRVAEEARMLEDREKNGREELPEGAHGSNKHFKVGGTERTEKLGGTEKPGGQAMESPGTGAQRGTCSSSASSASSSSSSDGENYLGIPYEVIIEKWWGMYNDGKTPVTSNRDVLTFELAVNLRHICGFDRKLMDRVIPCYDGFPEEQKMKCIDSALAERRTQMPKRLKDVLNALRQEYLKTGCGDAQEGVQVADALDEAMQQDELWHFNRLPKLPMGVSDSVAAAGTPLCMATLIGIAPALGALATGVKLDVHGNAKGLNLISYICGEFGSGKGQLDPIIGAWMYELQAQTDIYTQQEEEWAQKTRRMKSGKTPEQPKLPVRMLPLNNTLANIAERLGNAEEKHSFSFTPEADTVAMKWKSAMSDFSVMLRQAYDESRYDREAKSADATRVHIRKLLWNVTMCGTQDALYRVITNYTDGLLSRISIARTPDNTFAPLALKPSHLTDKQEEHIHQVAHLLPMMQGTVVLHKLEDRGREWLERIRIEAMKNDDRVLARQRLRGCVNAQRITCALWLCKVAESLIGRFGLSGAEKRLKLTPKLWITTLEKLQNDDMLQTFDLIADYLIDNDLYYFRERIEGAYESKNYQIGPRNRVGKNDSIFARLADEFSMEQAIQQCMAVKGANVSRNSVRMMLKNWRNQGLIVLGSVPNHFQKVQNLPAGGH